MARQRMYVFERAYVDYATRLRRFGRWLMNSCAGMWRWFWQGSGARAIEMLLRVCVIASGVVCGMLYVNYEKSHGRGWSLGMVFAFLLVAAFTCILAGGWKAPVHWVARAVAGTLASGAIGLLSIAVMVAAVVLFTLYIIVLALLTAASFLVFLPMRFLHVIWLLHHRITYTCPRDDCPSEKDAKRLPIHVCTCGAQYHDLQPSFYGIFHHVCRDAQHDGGQKRLPTLDLFGRNKLDRLCAGCKHPYIHSSVGAASPCPIFVIGGASAGKTVYLTQAISTLCDHINRLPDSSAKVDSNEQQKALDGQLERLNKGQRLDKTAGTVMEATGVLIQAKKKKRKTLLYLYDAPGEHFQTMAQFSRKQGMKNVRGIVLLVDPFALPALARYGKERSSALSPTPTPLDTMASNLVNLMQMLTQNGGGGKFNVPLAVVISKADALPVSEHRYLADLYATNGRDDDGKTSRRCRNALLELGAGNAVRALELHFARVRYFACSAMGRMYDPQDHSPFTPVGVTDPILWTIGLAGACGEPPASEPTANRAPANR